MIASIIIFNFFMAEIPKNGFEPHLNGSNGVTPGNLSSIEQVMQSFPEGAELNMQAIAGLLQLVNQVIIPQVDLTADPLKAKEITAQWQVKYPRVIA